MEDGLWIIFNVLLVFFLVFLNGFFVASEFALLKIRETRLTELVNTGNKWATIAQHILSRPDVYLSACQLGITLASLGLGWIGGPAIAHFIAEPLMMYLGAPASLIAPISYAFALGIIAFVHVVFGVLAPKSIAISKTEEASLWLSRPLMLFYKLTYPLIWLLNGTANKMLNWIGIRLAIDDHRGHTEEEIRILMKESHKNGHINENELTMVENIFDFSERVAREVMIPRTMFNCLYVDSSFEENLGMVKKVRHTRFPVVEGDKDHIIGWVHASDVYNAALSADKENKQIRSHIRSLTVVPESMEISQILKTMQKDRIQMVAVVDEFGGTSGLITLEDIIEEIVGNIQDEIREERLEVEVLEDGTSLDARMLIQEVNELFLIKIEDAEVNTIGGWMYSQLSEIPRVGQKVIFGELVFEITEVEHLRIKRIEVNALPWMNDDLKAVSEDVSNNVKELSEEAKAVS